MTGRLAATSTLKMKNVSITVRQLQSTVERYLGPERVKRSFSDYFDGLPVAPNQRELADHELLKFAERLLASAIGTASARVVMALLLQRDGTTSSGAMRLLDDASDAIVYNRDLLQSAIDHVEQGIAVFDQDLALVCWNTQFRKLLGLPPSLGKVGVPLNTVLNQLHEHFEYEGRALAEAHTQVLRMMAMQNQAFQITSADGSVVLDVRSNSMPDDGRVITFTDITQRVQTAQALEQRVRERTQELTTLNGQLEDARARAVEANVGKTRFIAAASHDILQPLNAARLFTSSLMDRTAHSANEKLVHNVDQSLEAVEEILSALLDMSRLDAGAIKPDVSRFAIGDLMAQLQTEFSLAAEDKGLRLNMVASSLAVESDRKLLRRILQNLISNAIKYTPSGKVLIGCRRRGRSVLVQVHDSGPGIPKNKQQLVYREFERLDQEGSAISGLGLGLAIVERMARVLNHPLQLHSDNGSGCTFSLELPMADARDEPVQLPRDVPVAISGRLFGLKVLVVDNEPSIIDGMSQLLTGWGCEVTTAGDGDQARELARAHQPWPYDMVLMDYHLNGENGIDLIGELRNLAGVVFDAALITAERSADIQLSAETAGVVYLRKPVRPAILRNVLGAARARSRQAAE